MNYLLNLPTNSSTIKRTFNTSKDGDDNNFKKHTLLFKYLKVNCDWFIFIKLCHYCQNHPMPNANKKRAVFQIYLYSSSSTLNIKSFSKSKHSERYQKCEFLCFKRQIEKVTKFASEFFQLGFFLGVPWI